MASFNANVVFTFVFCLQGMYLVFSKPIDFGGCGGCGGCGEYNNYPAIPVGPACEPAIAPSPPVSFVQVPQPFPIRVPVAPKPSVTIPNIILALLPPTNKPPCAPRPVIRPPLPPPAPLPIVLPLPQPCPYPVPGCGSSPYGYGSNSFGCGSGC